jgi:nucleoside-diphosphate-sugar epimerase
MKIVAIGLGYCARHFTATRGLASATLGTTRNRAQVEALRRLGFRAAFCDEADCDPEVRAGLIDCDALLVSAAPDENGDPVLCAFGAEIGAAAALRRIVYLSTVGVYGDHAGRWIEEDAEARPTSARSDSRLAAEDAWRRIGQERGARVHILRLAGIYGPGRNPLAALARGEARRIVKPGQVFNRVHVEDVARAIEAALASGAPSGVWNVADDEPTAPDEPIRFAAALLGLSPPPEIPFAEAAMTPMARSFWGECKRVANRRLKAELGVRLAYPTFREGLQALFAAGEGRGEPQ